MQSECAAKNGHGGPPGASDLQGYAAELLLLRAAGASLKDCLEALMAQGFNMLKSLAIVRVARGLGMGISLEDGIWLSSELRPARPAPAERLDLLHHLFEDPVATVQLAHRMALDGEATGLTHHLRHLGIEPLSLAFCCESDAEGEALLSRLHCELPQGMQVPAWGRSSVDRTPTFVNVRISPYCLSIVSPRGLSFYDCDLPLEMPPLHASHLRIRGGQGGRRLTFLRTDSLSVEAQASLERLPRALSLEQLVLKDCPRLKLDGPLHVTRNLELHNLPVLERWPDELSVGHSMTILNCPRLLVPEHVALPPTTRLERLPGLARLQDSLDVREEVVFQNCPFVDLPQRVRGRGTLVLRSLPGLTALPEGFTVEGGLVIEGCPIRALPKGMRVGGNLTLMDLDDLSRFPKDLEVGGRLRLFACRGLAFPACNGVLPLSVVMGEADA